MEKFTFFWGGPFSQWHSCQFTVDGIVYNCAEQFMMAKKAQIFGDEVSYQSIMESKSPRTQKALGRKVWSFDAETWNQLARDVVYRGNFAKFSQNSHLEELLRATIGTTLVEASPFDRIWGIGLKEGQPETKDRATWRGKNWLGEVLTAVRDDLIQGGEAKKHVWNE